MVLRLFVAAALVFGTIAIAEEPQKDEVKSTTPAAVETATTKMCGKSSKECEKPVQADIVKVAPPTPMVLLVLRTGAVQPAV